MRAPAGMAAREVLMRPAGGTQRNGIEAITGTLTPGKEADLAAVGCQEGRCIGPPVGLDP